jgi:hypothetical protein
VDLAREEGSGTRVVRQLKRAGGGFDASYNTETAVDGAARIIVTAELTNNTWGWPWAAKSATATMHRAVNAARHKCI